MSASRADVHLSPFAELVQRRMPAAQEAGSVMLNSNWAVYPVLCDVDATLVMANRPRGGRVQARALAGGATASTRSSTSASAKVCSRPLLSSRTRSSNTLRCSLVSAARIIYAVRAPAVLAVVGEQARVQLHVEVAQYRTGALGGEHLGIAADGCCRRTGASSLQPIQLAHHVHHALAVRERGGAWRSSASCAGRRPGWPRAARCSFEAVDARELVVGRKLPSTRRWVYSRGVAPSRPTLV